MSTWMCLRLTRKLRLRISKRSNLLKKRRIRSSRLEVRATTAGLRDVSKALRPQRTRRSILIRAMTTRKSPHSWKSMTVRGTRYSLSTSFDLLVTSRRSRWHLFSRWERTGCWRLNSRLRCSSQASLVRSRIFTNGTHRLLKLERGTMQALSY
jgi:hypothetical protein